jgi:hypothetical protein
MNLKLTGRNGISLGCLFRSASAHGNVYNEEFPSLGQHSEDAVPKLIGAGERENNTTQSGEKEKKFFFFSDFLFFVLSDFIDYFRFHPERREVSDVIRRRFEQLAAEVNGALTVRSPSCQSNRYRIDIESISNRSTRLNS